MITVKKFSELTEFEIAEFFKYLEIETQLSKLPAKDNMWHDEWEYKSNTLPYILIKTNRFKSPNGEFHIVYDNTAIVACGGVYKSEFCKEVALAGTRTWVSKEYRNNALLREYILPEQKEWAAVNDCKIVSLCFNDYNRNIIKIFKRNRLGEKNSRISTRSPHHLFYSGLHEVGFRVDIQYTPQWVIYEKLDPAWDYDWSEICATVTPDFSKNSTPATSL